MIRRRGIALRWRIALLTALAIGILSLVAVVVAFVVSQNALLNNLQRGLRADASTVVAIYRNGAAATPSQPLQGSPTGAVLVQLYDNQGRLLAASNADESAEAAIPREVITGVHQRGTARDWQGPIHGETYRAALEPFELGVVAILSPIAFVDRALRQVAQALLITAVILITLSAFISYALAGAAIRPIRQLAQLAAKTDPQNLQTLAYSGPNDEVGKLTEVLNDLILRLKAALDAQRNFLAETSHELRTPLTSLQGFLERASRRARPEVQRDLDDAKRIAGTMSRLVSDLLQLSRGEVVREIVPHLLDPYRDILEPVAEEFAGVRVRGAPGETLLGDPERLRQLLRNLTANAVRATGDPGQVELALARAGDTVVLTVADSGPGIPPEMQPLIFEKFYKGPGGGAGLGLAIAKQIAEVHGARLTVESAPGTGTRFSLHVPALEDALQEA
jgi:two-component system, OmpR family, sensor kinase